MTDVLASITAYKGMLVFELKVDQSSAEVHTSIDNPGVIGQVIMNTGKNLGISEEALRLLEQVPLGHDSLGDVDWFRSGDHDVFGWMGGPCALKTPEHYETARGFKIRSYVVIENVSAQGAMEAVEGILARDQREQQSI